MSRKYDTKRELLAAALHSISSQMSYEDHPGDPTGDASCEYADDHLLDAARAYVETHAPLPRGWGD
jgi:hypothetical protein